MAIGRPIDRRRSPRVESIHLVTFEAEGAEGVGASAVEVGRTLDVSVTGLRVETPTHLAVGRELDLEIAVGERVVRATGRVMHVEEAAEGLWEVGVQFTEVSREDQRALVE